MPTWAGTDLTSFISGFGIVEQGMAAVLAVLISWVVLRKLLGAAGL